MSAATTRAQIERDRLPDPEPAEFLPPDAEDMALIMNGVLPRCPCCQGTPTTFARHFPHSGIYQAYVHCSHCDVQVFKNARDLDEARQLAIATWSKRPTPPDNFVQKQSEKPEQWTCGTDELLNQCILLHIHASGFRAGCDKESLDHLTDLYTAAGPAFCREALPRLRDASTMDVPF